MRERKMLIVVKSVHHRNTAKVARAIADVLGADLQCPEETTPESLSAYELIGFGSGIYFGRFHADMRRLIQASPVSDAGRCAFLFSTSGLPFLQACWHGPIKRQLSRRGFKVIGEFSCRGHDTVGPLWLLGGLNRGHPNDSDLASARQFARTLLQRLAQDSPKDTTASVAG